MLLGMLMFGHTIAKKHNDVIMKAKPLFSTWQWLTVVGIVVTTGAAVTAFAFNTFETKSNFEQYLSLIIQRLDRMEAKIDNLLTKGE